MTNVVHHNRNAWNDQSTRGDSRWCEPVSPQTIQQAKNGHWQVILTPTKSVPKSWFGSLGDPSNPQLLDVLCLASGGGQQAPVLAAAGARVVSFDNSDAQLEKDALLAAQHDLTLTTEQGDMADLSRFVDASFDLIFHPVSNLFIANVLPVWRECARVLRPGGRLLAGFMNPAYYLFDHEAMEAGGTPVAIFSLPYADTQHHNAAAQAKMLADGQALEFSHSLEDQLGGQLQAGLSVVGFYEDAWEDSATPLNRLMPTSMATCAISASNPSA